MLLISHMQNARLPVNIRELEEQHFLTTEAGVDVQNDELRPVVEVIRVLVAIVFRPLDKRSDLFSSEIIGTHCAVISQKFHSPSG